MTGVFIRPSVTHDSRDTLSTVKGADTAARAFWNPEAATAMQRLLGDFRPEVVHAHKLYPQLSVAPVVVASRLRFPIVQTLHDFELLSASAIDGSGSWRDRDETRPRYRLLNSATFFVRRRIHVPRVRRFIAVSRFLAASYQEHGIEADVLPNFVESTPDATSLPRFADRKGILYLGRLRREKGVLDVIDLARKLPGIPVTIVGSGVLAERVRAAEKRLPTWWRRDSCRTPTSSSSCEMRASPLHRRDVRKLPETSHSRRWRTGRRSSPMQWAASVSMSRTPEQVGSPPDVETLVRTCAELHGDEETWVEMSKRGRAAVASAHSADAYVRRLVTMYEAATNRPSSTRER